MTEADRIRFLIARLARLDAAQSWDGGLNPAQRAALDYLARANRFSRAPSQVADFLGTTRGTTSQTLKALMRKGLVAEERSTTDKRSFSYRLTDAGQAMAAHGGSALLPALGALARAEQGALESTLRLVLESAIQRNGSRPFGICHTCRFFRPEGDGGHCTLLNAALSPSDTTKICHEHAPGTIPA